MLLTLLITPTKVMALGDPALAPEDQAFNLDYLESRPDFMNGVNFAMAKHPTTGLLYIA